MATRSQSYIGAGSVRISFFPCETCQDKNIAECAACYCEKCQQCFCRQCMGLHDQLFSKHIKYGQREMKNWPVSKDLVAFLQICEIHTNKSVDMFCNNHGQLCCSKCVIHRKCKKVTLNSSKIHSSRNQLRYVHELLVRLQKNMIKLKRLQRCCESSIQIFNGSYQKQDFMVREMNNKINAILNKIERSTLKKTSKVEKNIVKKMFQSIHSTLEEIEQSTFSETKQSVSSLQAPLKTGVDTCIMHYHELKLLQEALQYSSDKNKKELCFIAIRKCMNKIKQVESYLNENFVKFESSVLNQTIRHYEKYLSKLSGLWRLVQSSKTITDQANSDISQYLYRLGRNVLSNQVFTVVEKCEYNLRISSDSSTCNITAICVLPDGQVLIEDSDNKKVKLLNQQYQVVSHWDVSAYPWDMCTITPSEVAVTVNGNDGNTHEVQFITVNQSQLVTGKTLQLQHDCIGIAHHQGDLFISSYTAIYKYSLSGQLICKLYENTPDTYTVRKFAVSPTGRKLYLTSDSQYELLTLARDGTVLASYTDPELLGPSGVHVTPAGQVLICGCESITILQMDSEGRRKLATVATWKRHGLWRPLSVCYSSTTSSIIVGQFDNTILVYKVE